MVVLELGSTIVVHLVSNHHLLRVFLSKDLIFVHLLFLERENYSLIFVAGTC